MDDSHEQEHKYPRVSTFKVLSDEEWEPYKKIIEAAKKNDKCKKNW